MGRMERCDRDFQRQVKKDFYALVDILIDDYLKKPTLYNFGKTMIRLLKAILVYRKKINKPKLNK